MKNNAVIDFLQLDYVIRKHELSERSRLRSRVYKRFYAYSILHPYMTLTDLGKLFGVDHATVIYGIKQHNTLRYYEDYKHINRLLTIDLEECLIYCNVIPLEEMGVNEMISLVRMENLIQQKL